MKNFTTHDWKTITHWTATGLFAGLMLLSASMYLSGAAPIREALATLGYPAYILVILGTAKLLGLFALLQTRLPRLREWAYAGLHHQPDRGHGFAPARRRRPRPRDRPGSAARAAGGVARAAARASALGHRRDGRSDHPRGVSSASGGLARYPRK